MYVKFLKTNETEYWSLPYWLKDKIKAIWGVYVFDPNWRVHCCEVTASYELHQLRSQVEFRNDVSDEEIERVEEWILESEIIDSTISYMHCYRLDKIKPFKLGWFPKNNMGVIRLSGFALYFDEKGLKSDREERHNAAIDEAIEVYHQTCV